MPNGREPDKRGVRADRLAIRAVGACLVLGAVFVSTDVVLEVFYHQRIQAWAQPLKGAAFALTATVVVYFLVRRFARQLEGADESARRSADELRRSEARYRSLIEQVPGVVWLNEVDRDDPGLTHCVYVAPQLVDLLGRTPKEWMADDFLWREVVHPDDRGRVLEINNRADETGILSLEYRAIHGDGSTVWIHDEAVLIPAEGDRPAYWQGVMVDITAQRVQDEALHELSESLRGVFHASPLAISVLEPDGRVRHWNPAAERMFGWTATEVVGKPLPTVPSTERETFEEVRTRTLAGESLAGFETARVRRDGSRIEVSVSTAPLVDSNGEINAWVGVIEDITERKRVELALRTAEDRYRGLVEEGPAVVYLCDANQVPAQIMYVSPQIVDLLGFPRESWTADPTFWLDVIHAADRDRLVREVTAAIGRDEQLVIEYRMVAADGREVWVNDRASVVRDREGVALFRQGVLLDVTDRIQAEEERRLGLDRQLRLATRLELLHQIDRDVLSSASIEQMAEKALDHLRLLVPFDRGSVITIDQETDRFRYVAIRSSDLTVGMDLQTGALDDVTRERLARDVFLVPDMEMLDPQTTLSIEARRSGIRSALTVALRTDDRQVGVLALTSKTVDAFDDEAVDIAREVGSELAIAIAQTNLRETLADRARELERLAEERQQMLHRIVRAQEEERERVALELHDGLGQVLTSASLFASDLQEEVAEEARPRAIRVNELIRRAIVDSRQLVWSLRPPELERLGLVPALRRLADEISIPELTVDLHEEIGDIRLAPESEAVVYRVVQEAVHNAQKHAKATAISILLQRNNGQLRTLVEDNGRGFDPTAIPPGRGLGLIGMRERAELVKGALVVESASKAGTRVRLMVPIGATGGPGD